MLQTVNETAIHAVIFDAGGVLHRNNADAVLESLCESLAIDMPKLQALWQDLIPPLGAGEIDEPTFWRLASERYGIRAVSIKENLLGVRYEQTLGTYHQVLSLVKELAGRNIHTTVLSNTIGAHAAAMRRAHLFDDFGDVLLSYEIGLRKPDHRIFRLAVQRLKLDPQQILFIDDLAENVEGAQAVGLRTILAVDEQQIVRDVRKTLAL